jgi:16S rRNA (guanine527-N7)-methyltransferase
MSGDTATRRLPGVSRETEVRLETLAALLSKWNRSLNLVADASQDEIWNRHIRDSAQLLDLIPRGVTRLTDLGSGAGFPGLVIAILAAETHPGLNVTLIEADARKCAFLDTAIRSTRAPAKSLCARIEAASPQSAEIVTARALAPLETLLGYSLRHLAPEGRALFLKGSRHRDEIAEARRGWTFSLTVHPSLTGPEGAVLNVGGIARV